MTETVNEYLCQVGDAVSCGACCGLYNVAEPSRDALAEMLTRRTRWLESVAREVDAILAYADRVEKAESQDRPFADFHHCPYLGLVGENRSRVGCLLHPLGSGNRGIDLRGLSYYGGMACREYFCPSARNLPVLYKKMLKQAAQDWHAYGLMITEEELIRAFFGEVEQRLGRSIEEEDIRGNPALTDAIRSFILLKTTWRFRKHPHDGACHYFFKDTPHPRPLVEYEAIGASGSRYDVIFRELHSAFASPEELIQAESEIGRMADRITAALTHKFL